MFTRRRCCPTARCWWQGENGGSFLPARNCTTRPAGAGLPRAASTPRAIVTRRRCCPTARCWWQGVNNGGSLTSAELYDPASGSWTATGSLNTARYFTRRRCCPTARCWWQGDMMASATLPARNCATRRVGAGRPQAASTLRTLFSHGDVAAQRQGAGGRGYDGIDPLTSAQLCDPASGSWTATGSLNTARSEHTATLLPNGKVLVAGGESGVSDQRGTVRSSERDLDGHGQPQRRRARFTRRRCCDSGRCTRGRGS